MKAAVEENICSFFYSVCFPHPFSYISKSARICFSDLVIMLLTQHQTSSLLSCGRTRTLTQKISIIQLKLITMTREHFELRNHLGENRRATTEKERRLFDFPDEELCIRAQNTLIFGRFSIRFDCVEWTSATHTDFFLFWSTNSSWFADIWLVLLLAMMRHFSLSLPHYLLKGKKAISHGKPKPKEKNR